MNRLPLFSAAAAFSCVFSGTTLATDYLWNGSTDQNLVNAANWTGGLPPNDGTNVTLAAGDRIIMNEPINRDINSPGAINVPVGASITMGAGPNNDVIVNQLNVGGTGVGGTGAVIISTGGWGLPQNTSLTANTLVSIANGQRFRIDGNANTLALNGFTYSTVGGAFGGEINFVNTNVTGPGAIVANNLLSLEGGTKIPSTVSITMNPGTLMTSWESRNTRIEAAITMNTATVETRYRDDNRTFTGPVTLIGTSEFRAAVTSNNGDVNDAQPMQFTGPIGGAGAINKTGGSHLVLSGNNNYSGGTTHSQGTITVASNTALGTGAVTNVGAGNVIDFNNGGGLESKDSLVAYTGDIGGGAPPVPLPASQVGVNPLLTGLHSTQAFGQTRFYYSGKVSNPTGAPLQVSFAEQYDDDVFLSIDGTVLLNNNVYNTLTTGTINLTPGEHDIIIAVRDGVGGAGPNSGWELINQTNIAIGVGFRLGPATVNKADYTPLGTGFEVYQAQNRVVGNSFVLNQDMTMTTENMHGYTATVNGAITGGSNLTVQGSALYATDRLILTGTNTYGLTQINAGGSLQIGNGGTTGTLGTGTVTNNGELVFNRNNAQTVANAITGSGSVRHEGIGITTLTGVSSYAGTTTVAAGTLRVNGVTTSATTVNAGATIGGSGQIGSLTVQNSGTVAPGNSPGTLTVNGPLLLNSGSIFAAEIGGLGTDLLDVNGSVSVSGAVLNLTLASPAVLGTAYPLIDNDGADGITGTFAGISEGTIVNVSGQNFQARYGFNIGPNTITGGNDFALVAVPEPGVIGLAGFAALSLLRRRRRA